jgi:hypothetical protein
MRFSSMALLAGLTGRVDVDGYAGKKFQIVAHLVLNTLRKIVPFLNGQMRVDGYADLGAESMANPARSYIRDAINTGYVTG